MSDFNRQFLFEQVVESKPKPTMRQKLAKRTTFLTGTAAIALGAVVGAGVGAGVGVAVYNSWTRPAAVVVNDAKSVTWITGAAAVAAPSVVTINVAGTSGSGSG